jgi:hypothetical protein
MVPCLKDLVSWRLNSGCGRTALSDRLPLLSLKLGNYIQPTTPQAYRVCIQIPDPGGLHVPGTWRESEPPFTWRLRVHDLKGNGLFALGARLVRMVNNTVHD